MPRISEKTGRAVITAKRGDHGWTDEKRRFLHQIFTELNLSRDDSASLMHACFPDMMSVGYDATYRKFRDIWGNRNHSSHAKSWVDIARPRPAHNDRPANNTPYTAAEMADWARIRGEVHATAQAHGIVIAYKTTPTVGELGGPHLRPGQILPPPRSVPGPAGTVPTANANNTSNANNTANANNTITAAPKKRKATSSKSAPRKNTMAKRRKEKSEDEADAQEDAKKPQDEETATYAPVSTTKRAEAAEKRKTAVSTSSATAAGNKRNTAASSRSSQRKKSLRKRRKDDSEDEVDAEEDLEETQDADMEDDAPNGGPPRRRGRSAKQVGQAAGGDEPWLEAEAYEREMDFIYGGEAAAANDEAENRSIHRFLQMDPVVEEVLSAPVFGNAAAWMRRNGLQ